jgi:quinol monooxygenase YgiN
MIHVLASIQVKEGRQADFLAIFKANVPNVLKEAGCIEYGPTVDVATKLPPQVLDKNIVTIVEKWESLAHLEAHLVAPHMLAYKEKVKDIVLNVALKILGPA